MLSRLVWRSFRRGRRAQLLAAFGLAALVLATPGAAYGEDRAQARAPAVAEEGALTLTVIDAHEVAERIAKATTAMSGRVVQSTDDSLVVEVPRARRQEFVTKLRELGELRGLTLSSEDLSAKIADAESALRTEQAVNARLTEIAARGASVAEGLVIENAREQAATELANREAALRTLESRAQVTRMAVQLVAPPKEQLPGDGEVHLPFPWLDQRGLSHLMDMNEPPPELSPVLRGFIDGAFFGRFALGRPGAGPGTSATAGSLGLTMRALGEANPAGFFGGFDLWLGGGHGFAYTLQPMLGVGVPLGANFMFGVASGPGIDGITSVVPFGVTVPIELYLSVDLGSLAGVALWARDGWVLRQARKHGAPAAPFGDEAAVGIDVALGDADDSSYTRRRQGYVLGVGARQTLGTTIWELRLGWGAHEADMSEE